MRIKRSEMCVLPVYGNTGDILLAGVPLGGALLGIILSIQSSVVIKSIIAMMFISSVLLFSKNVKSCLNEGKLATLAFLAGFIGWYAFPAVYLFFSQDPLIGGSLNADIDNETILISVAYLFLFLVAWIGASTLFRKIQVLRPVGTFLFAETNVRRLMMAGIASCLVGVIPHLISGFGIREIVSLVLQSRSAEKPWLHMANLGDSRSPFLFLAQSALVGGAAILWLMTTDKNISKKLRFTVGVFAMLATIVVYFDQGTRAVTALMVFPGVISILMGLWGKSSLKFFSWFCGVTVAFVLIFQFQLFYRTIWTSPDVAEELLAKWITLGDTTDYFNETLFALRIVPAFHEYFRESVLFQFLASPIPRFIWPSKPASEVVGFYSLHRWGINIYEGGGNVFPGIVGQYYMSWGVFGPIMAGLLMGWVTVRTDGFLVRIKAAGDTYFNVVGFMLAAWIFLSYRVLSPGLLYPILVSCLIIFFSKSKGRIFHILK